MNMIDNNTIAEDLIDQLINNLPWHRSLTLLERVIISCMTLIFLSIVSCIVFRLICTRSCSKQRSLLKDKSSMYER